MKKKIHALIIAIILVLAFMPQFSSLGLGAKLQQPETAWAVRETGAPSSAWLGMASNLGRQYQRNTYD